MSTTNQRFMGVWKLRVVGPPAYLNEVYSDTVVEVQGLGGGDETDRRNLEFHAGNEVARRFGVESYDDLPERFTPLAFAEPELSTNMWVTATGTQQWFVGVYLVDRVYGGPEEGGWWFDAGELVQQTAVNSLDEAEELRERLRSGEFPATGRASSVLGGDDFRIAVGIEPHDTFFPKEVPHYE